MKASCAVSMLLVLLAGVSAEQGSPLGKVFELINSLEAKIVKEGEAEGKAFKEFFEWCDSESQNLNNEIKTGKKSQAKLSARIDEKASDIEVGTAKIEELAAALSTNEGELKGATAIREKEAADFAASEKELMATVDTLDRAVGIISAEMSKNPAALAQIDTSSMSSLLQSLTLVVDAAGFTGSDQKKLVALVQAQQGSDDLEMGAPTAASYKSQSGGIVDVLSDLKDKAETELAEARKAENTAKHNFAMIKKSLEDQMADDQSNMDAQKSGKDKAAEEKATAEGDLSVTVKALKESTAGLELANSDCMTTAADHEATVAARTEELKVIAVAEKILKESTSLLQGPSLLQMAASSKMRTRADLANSEVVTMVKKLAREHHSSALAQLASRIAVIARYGSKNGASGAFDKVKGLISDMIMKLEKEAESEATEKAYCDEEMAKTEAKKAELDDDIAKLTSGIDQAASRAGSLKEEVVELEAALAVLAKTQAEMDKIRAEQNAAYTVAKADLSKGLAGIRKALGVLRDYYGGAAAMLQVDDSKFNSFMQQPAAPQQHEKSAGAGGSIIGILEVVESDFATNLSKEESEEADSASNYEKVTQENKVATATKSQDAKYKTKEAAGLAKQIAELSSDKDTSSTELSAVMEYYGKIRERCVAKPESYEQRKARREAEIDGLKEALSILENEAAFVQRSRKGARRAHFMGA